MSTEAKTLEGLAVILGSLALGYLFRKRGWITETQAARLAEFNLTYFGPPGIILLFWALQPVGWSLLALPAICALTIFLLWPPSAWLGRRYFDDPRDLAPWVLCGIFSNQGLTYATFLCYLLLGTQGAALAGVFTLPFTPLLYLLGFYLVGFYVHGERHSPWPALAQTFRHAYGRNPMIALPLGLLLFALRVPFPPWGQPALDVLIPLSTAVSLFAIGGALRLSTVPRYWRPVLVMHPLKFLLQPALALALAYLFGLWGHPDRMLLRVVFLETATPVAIMALVVAQVSAVNLGLANAVWVTTNLFAVLWAPLSLYLARLL